jgi:hypothetical protein
MSEKQSKATDQVREHVNRACDAISEFRRDGINAEVVPVRQLFQAAALKVAREELSKAIAIIERKDHAARFALLLPARLRTSGLCRWRIRAPWLYAHRRASPAPSARAQHGPDRRDPGDSRRHRASLAPR